ncbi:TTAGGG repeat binding factor [Exophiala oligosperma]
MSNDLSSVQAAGEGTGEAVPPKQQDEALSQPVQSQPSNPPQDDSPRSPKRRRLSPVENHPRPEASSVVSADQQKKESEPTVVPQSTPTNVSAPASTQSHHAPPQPPKPQPSIVRNRLDSLPVLESLAADILTFLASLSPTEALGLSRTPATLKTREYLGLRSKFDPIRRMFYTGQPFLSASDLQLQDANHIQAIRKINQAIFMSSIFTGEIGLRDMDRGFLPVLVPDNGYLQKSQASVFLALKTQGFITAWRTGAAPPHVVVADMFAPDLDKQILARRPGTTTLAPTEQDFLNQVTARREILQTHAQNNTLDQLALKYPWDDFSREVSSYLYQSIESASKNGGGQGGGDASKNAQRGQMEGQFSIHAPPVPTASTESIFMQVTQGQTPSLSLFGEEFIAQAARAAEIAMKGLGAVSAAEAAPTAPPTAPPPPTKSATPASQMPLPDYQQYEPPSENIKSESPLSTPGGNPDVPHSSQTAPTLVLYERARQAAAAKTSLTPRKGVVPAQRRPWTPEEEHALMKGIDQVKGGHWSQILAMYGPGGTVNETLKDRNQVQLKDKARNLKLYFLKSGVEVPYYLQAVTGDLRTRAPGQASKLEDAKERERLQLEADQVSFEELEGDEPPHPNLVDSGTPLPTQASPVINEPGQASPPKDVEPKKFEPSMADVEAMIARAAAQAAQEAKSTVPGS